MQKIILLVEDDEADAYLVQRGFRHLPFDYHLEIASDAKQALVFLAKCKTEGKSPDLILLDLFMPGMDGFEFLETVRSDEDWSDIRIVVLTGIDNDESILRAYQTGATSFLAKPSNKYEFQKFVAQAAEWWSGGTVGTSNPVSAG